MSSSPVTLPPADPLAGTFAAMAELPAPVELAVERDAGAGLSERTLTYLSGCKGEPAWLQDARRAALRAYLAAERMVPWAPAELSTIPFDRLHHYSAPPSVAAGRGRVCRFRPRPGRPRRVLSAAFRHGGGA
jgi:hypothetical protein